LGAPLYKQPAVAVSSLNIGLASYLIAAPKASPGGEAVTEGD